MVRLVWIAGLITAAVAAAGCANDCARDSDCPDGSFCGAGLCLEPMPGAGGTGGGGGSGGGGNTGGGPCDTDRDGDTVCDAEDNCPDIANADQLDGDGDRAGDPCDPCPADPENDADGDGVCGDVDVCPDLANPSQVDTDGDGRGNACDPDDDDDGVDDLDDCAPIDPTIYPGAFDACDGVDRDCVNACRWPVTALGTSQRIVDVSCFSDTRRCVVVTTTAAGMGSLLLVELGDAPSLVIATALPAPRGVAAAWVRGKQVAWVTGAAEIQGLDLTDSGSKFSTLATGGGSLTGAIATQTDNYLGIAPMEDSRLLMFSPDSVMAGSADLNCSGSTTRCQVVAFDMLGDNSGGLGMRHPRGLTLREGLSNQASKAYLTFEDDRRVAVITVAAGLLYRPQSSGLLAPGPSEAAELLYNREFDSVYLLDGAGAGARIAAHYDLALHRSDTFPAPAGSCPTTLGLFGSRIAVGDDCGDGDPGLLLLDLDKTGLPIAGDSVRLPGCSPRRIAAVPSGEGLGPPVLAIACEEADSLLFVGRD